MGMAFPRFGRERTATRQRIEPQLQGLEYDLQQALGGRDLVAASRISADIANRLESASQVIAADVKLQTNEQIKSSATFVNGFANTLITAGVATPVLGFFVPGSPYSGNAVLIGEVSGTCLVGALIVHTIARSMLRRLRS